MYLPCRNKCYDDFVPVAFLTCLRTINHYGRIQLDLTKRGNVLHNLKIVTFLSHFEKQSKLSISLILHTKYTSIHALLIKILTLHAHKSLDAMLRCELK